MARPLRVLTVTSEAVPFAKTGGLADVAGVLPESLAQLGCEVRGVLPRYRQVDRAKLGLEPIASPELRTFAGKDVTRQFLQTRTAGGVEWYFVDAPEFYDRPNLYTADGKDYPDNFERFAFFCQEVLELIRLIDWKPDIIHCHDWQSGLIPGYLKVPVRTSLIDTGNPFYRGIRTLFTVHNIAYQGLFPKGEFPLTGYDPSHFIPDEFEFYGKVNFMKAGLIFADRLSTVSRRYAEEVQTPEFSRGMEGVLEWRAKDLVGILNGIDVDDWDPKNDPALPAHYGADDLSGKDACRRALLKSQGLEARAGAPVVGMITRLDAQKGLDLVEAAFDRIMDLGVRMIVLGTGAPQYHAMLERMAKAYPRQLALNLRFDPTLARQIEAGADMFLMPSRFEPCGLNQMYSLRYGTVPIVHATGGLVDTITDYSPRTRTGNGFSFDKYTPRALVAAMRRAVRLFADRQRWLALVRTGMRQDFSWQASAQKYVELYRDMLGEES